jgi:hypothetical protein
MLILSVGGIKAVELATTDGVKLGNKVLKALVMVWDAKKVLDDPMGGMLEDDKTSPVLGNDVLNFVLENTLDGVGERTNEVCCEGDEVDS